MKGKLKDTCLSQAVTATRKGASYDANVKFLLADKQILSRILKYTIKEFRDMNVQDIMACIGNNIGIESIPLDPGLTNLDRVREDNTEDSIPGEGTICYDIRFSAFLNRMEIKFLIDLEAQRLTSPGQLGYYLENRIIYYISRMISAQKNTEFFGSDFDNLKNVRSIWICMGNHMQTGSIEEINLERKTVFGEYGSSHQIDLLQGIIINIHNQKGKETKISPNPLITMLETLLSGMEPKRKKQILEKEYGMIMTVEMERRIQTMCNLSEGIMEEGRTEGELNCCRQNIIDLLEDFADIPQAVYDQIYAEKRMDILRRLLKAAARAESIVAFQEALNRCLAVSN